MAVVHLKVGCLHPVACTITIIYIYIYICLKMVYIST
jgi:hypothetical protein